MTVKYITEHCSGQQSYDGQITKRLQRRDMLMSVKHSFSLPRNNEGWLGKTKCLRKNSTLKKKKYFLMIIITKRKTET